MEIETDERCMDLAKHFLSGGTALLGEPQDCFENQVSLARHIQAAVEDWFTANEPGTRYGSSEPENERVRGLADLRRDGRIAK